jgi:hypothetical protein
MIFALCHVDVSAVAEWIAGIDFAEWPQQHPIDAGLRPAMVTDLAWHGFGERTDHLVSGLMLHFHRCESYNRMLSVVMAGHAIEPHRDEQASDWVTRVHVPLGTNPSAMVLAEDRTMYRMNVGMAYKFDTRESHTILNRGATPRIHFMFDVRRS